MKHLKHLYILAALAAFAALAASCAQFLDPPAGKFAEGAGRVILSVSAGGTARTILPTEVPSFSRYELEFTRDGDTVTVSDTSGIDGAGVSQDLDSGEWTAAVKAYRSFTPSGGSPTEYLAAGGEAPFNLTAGQTVPVSVSVTPVPLGDASADKGIFTYTVSFPKETRGPLSIGGVTYLLTNEETVSMELESSYYELAILLEGGFGTAGAADVVHVYSGLESKAAYTFTEADFVQTVPPGLGPGLYEGELTATSSPADLSSYSGNLIENALDYIATQSLSGTTSYIILLDETSYTLAGKDTASTGNANIATANAVITLTATGPADISLSSSGTLFYITGGKLILGNRVTLKGASDNTTSLVCVEGSSTALVMKAGAKISGNSVSSSFGGGVYVYNNGSFTMEGGEISGNSANAADAGVAGYAGGGYGGGVYIYRGGFSKTGGTIYGDTDSTHTPGSSENTVTRGNTYGHAVFYRGFSSEWHYYDYYRDASLGESDNTSTSTSELPMYQGETLNGWTRK